MLITPSTISTFLLQIQTGYPWSLFNESFSYDAYTNSNASTIALALPVATDIPWQVDLRLVGNTSAGTTNVVLFGPKFAKKTVSPYIRMNPIQYSLFYQWSYGKAIANIKPVMKKNPII